MQYAFLSHVLDSTKECYKDKRIIPEKIQTHFYQNCITGGKVDLILAGPKVN